MRNIEKAAPEREIPPSHRCTLCFWQKKDGNKILCRQPVCRFKEKD